MNFRTTLKVVANFNIATVVTYIASINNKIQKKTFMVINDFTHTVSRNIFHSFARKRSKPVEA